MIKMVIFDMAGTAIDEDNMVYKTIQKTINDHGYAADLDLVLLHGAGKEKWQAIYDILFQFKNNTPEKEDVDKLYKDFQENLDIAYNRMPMKLFEAIPSVIKKLTERKIKVVFNTSIFIWFSVRHF